MRCFRAHVFAGILFVQIVGQAADIEGTVIVKRKLTPRKVTATAPAYQRGPAVELGNAADNGLDFERKHVAIYLEGPAQPKGVTATLGQKNRQFTPDMLVVPEGSTVSFPNFDPIFHNVFSLSKPKSFDLGNYPKNQTRVVTFSNPGIVFVNCHLHPNMSAVIVITPNEWNTVPDAGGKFTLQNVPAGHYTVVAWHKSAGFFRQKLDLGAGGASVQFFIPIEE
jgi:plastocyanin